MNDLEKKISVRNRTIKISEEEKTELAIDILKEPSSDMTNQIVNADIMNVIDAIPSHFADLIIIDPPYNLSKQYSSSMFRSMSDSDYVSYMESWFPKVCSKLKTGGSMYVCGDWRISALQYGVISKYLTVMNRITWQREKGRGAKNNWKNSMEDIWFAVMDKDNYYFDVDSVKICRKVIAPYKENGKPKDWQDTSDGKFRITYPSNFWDDITVPFWSMPENTDHPTQKPEKLIAKLIMASSRPGDMVFDPFAGSFTTCVSAKKLGRNFLGIERELNYCLLGAKRVKMASNNKEIQGYCDKIFWERNSLQYQKNRNK